MCIDADKGLCHILIPKIINCSACGQKLVVDSSTKCLIGVSDGCFEPGITCKKRCSNKRCRRYYRYGFYTHDNMRTSVERRTTYPYWLSSEDTAYVTKYLSDDIVGNYYFFYAGFKTQEAKAEWM
eukprot:392529_1